MDCSRVAVGWTDAQQSLTMQTKMRLQNYRTVILSNISHHYFTENVSRHGRQRSARRHSAVGRIKSIGNRTCYLPAYGAASQPTASPFALLFQSISGNIRFLLTMFKGEAGNVFLLLAERRHI